MASVLVTGASSGIGEACARRLHELGHRVFAGVRDPAAAERLDAVGDRMVPVTVDVTDAGLVAAAADEIDAAVGAAGLDGVVNNAGIAVGGPVEFLPLDEWRRQFEVNVFGQVAVTQAVLPMIRRARGRVVFVGSMAGRVSTPFGGPYGASKHALEGIAQSLREELAPWEIPVSLVEPGMVSTPIWDKGAGDVQRITDLMGPDAERLYGDAVRRLEQQIHDAGASAATPVHAVGAVEHALFDARPRPRYAAGRDAQLIAIADRLLPDRALSWLLRRSGP